MEGWVGAIGLGRASERRQRMAEIIRVIQREFSDTLATEDEARAEIGGSSPSDSAPCDASVRAKAE